MQQLSTALPSIHHCFVSEYFGILNLDQNLLCFNTWIKLNIYLFIEHKVSFPKPLMQTVKENV